MKKNILTLLGTFKYNAKTLIAFELVYLVLGIVFVYPLVQLLFFLSIRLSGYDYITNTLMLEYLLLPQTLIMFLVMALIFSVYIVIELVFLAILFDYSHHKVSLNLRSLFHLGIRESFLTLKKNHVLILGPAFLFFFIVEAFHVVGFASTLDMPRYITEELRMFLPLQILFYGLVILLIFLFIETILTINITTFEGGNYKTMFHKRRLLLKGKRIKMILQFLMVNFLLNLILYTFYILIMAALVGIVALTRGQSYALGFLLSILYTGYVVSTTLATVILVPINYALVSTWYYDHAASLGYERRQTFKPWARNRKLDSKWFRRGLLALFTVILGLNIASTFAVIGQNRPPAEFLNRSRVIAHRGATLSAPENTMAALEFAIAQEADAVEFDVNVTADNIPILMHDSTLGRTTNDSTNQLVNQVTLAYIKTLDAGSWYNDAFIGEPVPTLEAVFEQIGSRTTMYVDLKANTPAFNQAVVDLIVEYGLENRTKVMSFSLSQLSAIKAINPDIETVLLIGTFLGNYEALVNHDNIDNVAFRTFLLRNNPDYIRKAHSAGKNVYVWTLETQAQHEQFVDLDVDGLITKDPILAREVAFAKNANPTIIDWLRDLFSPTVPMP